MSAPTPLHSSGRRRPAAARLSDRPVAPHEPRSADTPPDPPRPDEIIAWTGVVVRPWCDAAKAVGAARSALAY
jgi:hypothetical protein